MNVIGAVVHRPARVWVCASQVHRPPPPARCVPTAQLRGGVRGAGGELRNCLGASTCEDVVALLHQCYYGYIYGTRR